MVDRTSRITNIDPDERLIDFFLSVYVTLHPSCTAVTHTNPHSHYEYVFAHSSAGIMKCASSGQGSKSSSQCPPCISGKLLSPGFFSVCLLLSASSFSSYIDTSSFTSTIL